MGGPGRGISRSGESRLLAFESGRTASPASGVVFTADGVLLLAMLERGEAICYLGSGGVRRRQWLSARPDRIFTPALVDLSLGWHKVMDCRTPWSRDTRGNRPDLGRRTCHCDGRRSNIHEDHARLCSRSVQAGISRFRIIAAGLVTANQSARDLERTRCRYLDLRDSFLFSTSRSSAGYGRSG